MVFGISAPNKSDQMRAYARILIFALKTGGVYMAPILPNGHQDVSPANLTSFHPFGNYSVTSIASAVLNTTVPVYTPPMNGSHSAIMPYKNQESCSSCKGDGTDVGGSDPQMKATVPKNGTSLNLIKKEIHPSFFYQNNKMHIRCAPPKKVIDIEPRENSLNFPFERWPRWKKEYVDKSRALVDIEVLQRSCRQNCECDDAGAIISRYRYGPNAPCGKQWQVDRCIVVLACYCTALLVQPSATGQEAPIEEYQAALDRIPQTFMRGLKRRPGESMTWVPSEMDRMMRASRLAQLGSEAEAELPLSGPEPRPRWRGLVRPPAMPAGRYLRGLRFGRNSGLFNYPWLEKREISDNYDVSDFRKGDEMTTVRDS
ncbi:hypothetical protein TWF506_011357 [Arthrobotrys conoides]|uniref:Uncharacterized protein n=1 Tax=Arthrobotrys conoides TaxID=74498 RepID=A0AAN8RNW1_9PEZI